MRNDGNRLAFTNGLIAQMEINELRQQLGKPLQCNIYYDRALMADVGTEVSSNLIDNLIELESELLRFTSLPDFSLWKLSPAFAVMA